ncbi:MAG: hypothetical protein HC831_09770 [Chloroflexia bacterium]|nr:hypothetical protein [Chloroflexia bacterium]
MEPRRVFFAMLIYNDYPNEIEQHIRKITNEYFRNAKYPSTYDIQQILEVLLKGQKKDKVEPLIKKIESDEYEIKLIQEIIDEVEEILK